MNIYSTIYCNIAFAYSHTSLCKTAGFLFEHLQHYILQYTFRIQPYQGSWVSFWMFLCWTLHTKSDSQPIAYGVHMPHAYYIYAHSYTYTHYVGSQTPNHCTVTQVHNMTFTNYIIGAIKGQPRRVMWALVLQGIVIMHAKQDITYLALIHQPCVCCYVRLQHMSVLMCYSPVHVCTDVLSPASVCAYVLCSSKCVYWCVLSQHVPVLKCYPLACVCADELSTSTFVLMCHL